MKGKRKRKKRTRHLNREDRESAEEKKARIRASLQRSGKPSEFPKSVPKTQARRSNPGSRR